MDADELIFRASPIARLMGWLMGATGVGVVLWSMATLGGAELPSVIIGALVVLAATVIRMRVHATPAHLVICSGLRRRTHRWEEIQGFRIEDGKGQRRVVALVDDDRIVELPIANGGVLLTSRREARYLRDELDQYRASRV